MTRDQPLPPDASSAGDYDQAVYTLAALTGIAVDWIDAGDRPQRVTPASLRTMLATLGLPCDSIRQTRDSMARWQHDQQETTLPPLMTAVVGQPIALPSQCALHGRYCSITLESGRRIERRVSPDSDANPVLDPIDECGYHHVQAGDVEMTLAVAPRRCYSVADAFCGLSPDAHDAYATRCENSLHQRHQGHHGHHRHLMHPFAAPAGKGWGLALQLYGLRSEGDGGIGTFGALTQLVGKAGAEGATAVAISPVHAMFSADPRCYSPYSPSSRLMRNVLHIDPAAILGPEALSQALADAGPETVARHQRLEQAQQIFWPEAGRHRMALLRRLYNMFRMRGLPSAELAAFRLQGGQALADHALFEALHHWLLGKHADVTSDWRRWPQPCQAPDSPGMKRFVQEQSGEIDFHLFLQWQASRGLQAAQQAARDGGMAVGLIADLAVGAANGGSQAWSHQAEMITGLTVGAPPDLLNARGQNWGIGAFSPMALRAQGYRSYIAMLRCAFAHAGGVRIDHVMGLTRLWLTPEGADASEGAYLRYPATDLMRLIALESWRHRAIVIGEDLGTVPEGFGEALEEAGMLGIGVLWFARGAQQRGRPFLPPQQWRAQAIATTSTHDLPTVAGWWRGADLTWRSKLDLLTPGTTEAQARGQREEERTQLWQALLDAECVAGTQPADDLAQPVVDGAAAFIAQTPAPLALLPMEDLLGLEEQPNLPGTVDVHPNWRRRLPLTAATVLEQADCRRRLRLLQRTVHPDHQP